MRNKLVYPILLTISIFCLNFFLRTMIHPNSETIEFFYNLHLTEFPFKLRPFTNLSISFLANFLSISLYYAFMIQQYFLLFFFFVSFSYFLKNLKFNLREQTVGLSITAFLFPILCIHFIPVFSWDDIWAYICIVWFMNYIIKNNFYVASIFLTLALISRESLVMVLPAYYIFRNQKESSSKWYIPMLLPVLTYGVLRTLLFPEILEGRFTRFIVNFEDLNAVRQSVYSLFVSFGWMWTIVFLSVFKRFYKASSNFHASKFKTAALVVSVITIIVVSNTALIRETRLLFTPFIFIIPFVLSQLTQYKLKFIDAFHLIHISLSIFIILTIFVASILFTVAVFPSFSYLPMIDFHRVYFALNIWMSILFIISGFLSLNKFKKTN